MPTARPCNSQADPRGISRETGGKRGGEVGECLRGDERDGRNGDVLFSRRPCPPNPDPRRLLIVAHSPSENTRRLTDALVRGATSPDVADVEVILRPPLQAVPEDVLAAQAIILGTTENLGYMSGALKDFFDRIYYPCLEKTQGLPYVLYIRAGQDGTGTSRAWSGSRPDFAGAPCRRRSSAAAPSARNSSANARSSAR